MLYVRLYCLKLEYLLLYSSDLVVHIQEDAALFRVPPHVHLWLSLYLQLCIRAAAWWYPVRSIFKLFQCAHCSLCPARRVVDDSIPVLIYLALCFIAMKVHYEY